MGADDNERSGATRNDAEGRRQSGVDMNSVENQIAVACSRGDDSGNDCSSSSTGEHETLLALCDDVDAPGAYEGIGCGVGGVGQEEASSHQEEATSCETGTIKSSVKDSEPIPREARAPKLQRGIHHSHGKTKSCFVV